MNLNHEHFY